MTLWSMNGEEAMRCPRTLMLGLCFFLGGGTMAQDKDADGDGLSDFQEIHKYFTDPKRKDSDGDGLPDADWNERREYTYSIRSVIQVMPPYRKSAFNDDYQDARVLEEREDYIELEVIHYPLNTCRDAIHETKRWRRKTSGTAKYLEAGITTNWDAAMRRDLQRRLGDAGIDLASLTDRQAAEKVSAWALEHARGLEMFTTYAVHFPRGRPEVHPRLLEKFEGGKGNSSWSAEEQFQHEILGRGMYTNRTRGSCTSSAVYLTTVLRAVGIPTRMIITIPVVDASDARNVELVKTRLTHHAVRQQVLEGIERLGSSFAAHTFNEVWVGGRWRRLNYSVLDYTNSVNRLKMIRDLENAPIWMGHSINQYTDMGERWYE